MSHTVVRITPKDFAPPAVIDRMRSRSLVVGVVFSVLALALTLGLSQWDLFLRAWLHSFMFWLGLTTGSLALLMLQYVSGGNWGRLGRRIWEAAAGNWWLMFLFWLPIAIGMKRLYVWATVPQDARESAHIHLRQPGVFGRFRSAFYRSVGCSHDELR